MSRFPGWAKPKVRRLLSLLGYSIRRTDPLTALADKYGSDKGNFLDAHGYCRIYNDHFKHLRKSEVTLAEIGVARGASLQMWREYFERGRIFGFDNEDLSGINVKGCTIIRGNMSVERDLAELVKAVNRPITILIDDASHICHHQQFALGTLFPSLSSGGFYAIEDMHWPYAEPPDARRTRDVLRRFSVTGVLESPYLSGQQRQYLENNIESLTLYDSLTMAKSDMTDGLAIIVKK